MSWGSLHYIIHAGDGAAQVWKYPWSRRRKVIERLKYQSLLRRPSSSAVLQLQWEKVKIPFTIASVDLRKKTQVDAYRYAFNSGNFYEYWQNMQLAAEFCLLNDVNIEEGKDLAGRTVPSTPILAGMGRFSARSKHLCRFIGKGWSSA